MQKARTRGYLLSQQRRMLLRVISGYRPISAEATAVIAGVPPIDLLGIRLAARRDGVPLEEIENDLYRAWQERWRESPKGR